MQHLSSAHHQRQLRELPHVNECNTCKVCHLDGTVPDK